MAKFQTKDWISIALFSIAIFLMAYNHFNKENGIENENIEILSWVMFVIANLHMLFTNIKRVKSKEKSLK